MLIPGRIYMVKFADHYHGPLELVKEPEIMFATGLYEADVYEEGQTWIVLTNWWSSTDYKADVREASFVIKSAIIEYWDVSPNTPGLRLTPEELKRKNIPDHGEDGDTEDDETGEQFAARLPLQGEPIQPQPSPPERDGHIPYIG